MTIEAKGGLGALLAVQAGAEGTEGTPPMVLAAIGAAVAEMRAAREWLAADDAWVNERPQQSAEDIELARERYRALAEGRTLSEARRLSHQRTAPALGPNLDRAKPAPVPMPSDGAPIRKRGVEAVIEGPRWAASRPTGPDKEKP